VHAKWIHSSENNVILDMLTTQTKLHEPATITVFEGGPKLDLVWEQPMKTIGWCYANLLHTVGM